VNIALIHKLQGNVLIDGSGNPCLADFGLATVVGDPELQWTTMTLERGFSPRWRAPEVIGIRHKPERPTFKSDIYSFGSVMFFVCPLLSVWLYSEHSAVRSSLGTYHGKRRSSRI